MARAVEALGPVGQRVGRRIKERRIERGLTLQELANELQELGRPILLSALSKIEKGQRRVDTDDLLALALALQTSPNMLLFSPDAGTDTKVMLTPTRRMNGANAWLMATSHTPAELAGHDRGFYISYDKADRLWAEWITWTLEKLGYTTFYDAWDIRPGDDLDIARSRGIRRTGYLLAILSDHYGAARENQLEWGSATKPGLRFHGRLLPVLVSGNNLAPFATTHSYVDLREVDEQAAQHRLATAALNMIKPYEIPEAPFPDPARAYQPPDD
jgi:transcriptional regulator with XRE-family HTH domain